MNSRLRMATSVLRGITLPCERCFRLSLVFAVIGVGACGSSGRALDAPVADIDASSEEGPPPDAGPPRVEFAYGPQYPDPGIQGANGVLIPEYRPLTWITVRVIARHDPVTQALESVEGLRVELSVRAVGSGTVIAATEKPMTAIFEKSSSFHLAWADVEVAMCVDPVTIEGSAIEIEATVRRGPDLFAHVTSGPQTISCEGDPECEAECRGALGAVDAAPAGGVDAL